MNGSLDDTNYIDTHTGSYTVTLTVVEDDHGDDVDNATPMSVGESIDGSLTNDDFGNQDEDYFAFEAEAGQTLLFEVAVSSGEQDDVRVFYQRSDGEWFRTESPKEWTASTSGVQYVGVSGYSRDVTYYTLSVTTVVDEQAQDRQGNDIQNAADLAVGMPVDSALDYQGDEDFFRFTAETGRVYRING